MKILFVSFLLLSLSYPVFSQSELILSSCEDLFFAIDDNSDPDGDGEVCEKDLILQNNAMYTNPEGCETGDLEWTIFLDLDSDGIYDVEYSSVLPSTDVVLDDTNMNGIPDLYIYQTNAGESQTVLINDIEGPFGEINILWQVRDDCNTEVQCLQRVFLEDKKSPSILCLSLSTYVFDGLESEIFASDYHIGAYDNCTYFKDLKVSFSLDQSDTSRVITCDDVVNSPIDLRIYVFDESGNADFCPLKLNVIPNEHVDCFPFNGIDGYVRSEDNKPIENAKVTLGCVMEECSMVTYTDTLGYYSFNGFYDIDKFTKITVDKQDSHSDYISTFDLVKIYRHILGVKPFTTPYQYIAADVNNDERLKATDLVLLRKLYLGVITELPLESSWKFVNAEFEFPNDPEPWIPSSSPNLDPFSIPLNQFHDGRYDFIGVKIGNIID